MNLDKRLSEDNHKIYRQYNLYTWNKQIQLTKICMIFKYFHLVSVLTSTPFLFSLPVDIVRLPGKVPLLPSEKREANFIQERSRSLGISAQSDRKNL